MERFTFVKSGIASKWYQLPEKQAGQAARKEFGLTHQLFNQLLKSGQITVRKQKLINGYWKF